MSPSLRIQRSTLSGTIAAPPSKSHSIRAIFFAALAQGRSRIENLLPSPDVAAALTAVEQLGAQVTQREGVVFIEGVAGKPQLPSGPIDVGNSGLVLRFSAAIAACLTQEVIITGDESIQQRRSVKPYIDSLPQLAVRCESIHQNDHAPILVCGPMQSGTIQIAGQDSQPISALMMAALLVEGELVIKVNNAGEKPWLDLTLSWLERLGVEYQRESYRRFIFPPQVIYDGFDYVVPGDFSSVSYPLAAAILTDSAITVTGLDLNDAQGDKELLPVLQRSGANLILDQHQIVVQPGSTLQLSNIDANAMIDAVPLLAVLACFSSRPCSITGAAIAKLKESDRLISITANLQRMGAAITAHADGCEVQPSCLQPTVLSSYGDHRMVMSLAVAALATEGETIIHDVACVQKSFPNFVAVMQSLGARIKVVE